MNLIINFENTYDPISIKSDLSEMTFKSLQTDGSEALILAKIEPLHNQYLPNVYNLGFGPPAINGTFNDNIRLKHANNSKVLSTVIFLGLTFLQENPELTIGVDGSDDTRATLYHMMYKINREYLHDFFLPIGVDWYVRVFRDWSYEVDEEGHALAKPRPEPFDFERSRRDLYRYYMFHLRA